MSDVALLGGRSAHPWGVIAVRAGVLLAGLIFGYNIYQIKNLASVHNDGFQAAVARILAKSFSITSQQQELTSTQAAAVFVAARAAERKPEERRTGPDWMALAVRALLQEDPDGVEEALVQASTLVPDNPWVWIALARSRYAERDRFFAVRVAEAGFSAAQKMAEAAPDDLTTLRVLADVLDMRGDIAKKFENWKDARTAYDLSKAIRTDVSGQSPRDVQWRRDLAVSWIKIGDLETAMLWAKRSTDMGVARAAYDETKAIAEEMRRDDPDSVPSRRYVTEIIQLFCCRSAGDFCIEELESIKNTNEERLRADPENPHKKFVLARSWDLYQHVYGQRLINMSFLGHIKILQPHYDLIKDLSRSHQLNTRQQHELAREWFWICIRESRGFNHDGARRACTESLMRLKLLKRDGKLYADWYPIIVRAEEYMNDLEAWW